MKHSLVAALFISMLTAAVAHAEDQIVRDDEVTDPSRLQRGYAGVAMHLGNAGDVDLGESFELGARVTGPLWVRAGFDKGEYSALTFFDSDTQNYMGPRAGIEARACADGGFVACAYGGVDLAVRDVEITHQDMSSSEKEAMLMPRAGIELGKVLRFRVGVEGSLGTDAGHDGLALTTGLVIAN